MILKKEYSLYCWMSLLGGLYSRSHPVHIVLHPLVLVVIGVCSAWYSGGHIKASGGDVWISGRLPAQNVAMNMEHGGARLGPTGLLDSFVNSLMISDMHLHAPPESGGRKGCLQTYLLPSLRSDKVRLDCCEGSVLCRRRGGRRSDCSGLILEAGL